MIIWLNSSSGTGKDSHFGHIQSHPLSGSEHQKDVVHLFFLRAVCEVSGGMRNNLGNKL